MRIVALDVTGGGLKEKPQIIGFPKGPDLTVPGLASPAP